MLTAIAAGLLRATEFRAVVINLRRPEWDDFEVVVSLGEEDDAYEALMGATTTWADWGPFLVPEHEIAGAYFIPAGHHGLGLRARLLRPGPARLRRSRPTGTPRTRCSSR